MSLVTPIFDFE